MSASDCFEFWICFRIPKNKIHVFFYSGPFSYLGGETNPQSYKIFRCPSPIDLVFGDTLEERKIRNTCFFILACLHVSAMKPPPEVYKNSWCPPPIALNFGYVLEGRKIGNACLSILAHLHVQGVEPPIIVTP